MKKRLIPIVAALAVLCALAAGGAMTAFAVSKEPAAVVLDKTYLTRAVVSAEPVVLHADVRNDDDRNLDGKEVTYAVTAGENVAEIRDGNLLYVKAAGQFTVRAAYKEDDTIFEEFTGTAYNATFSGVQFNNKFENITVYTQPMLLSGNVTVMGIELPDDCHYELLYEVTAGPAEIFGGNYLRVTGKGDVTVAARSRYDAAANVTATFTVTDPDEGNVAESGAAFKQSDVEEKGGCGSEIAATGSILLATLAFCGILSIAVVRRKKNIERK